MRSILLHIVLQLVLHRNAISSAIFQVEFCAVDPFDASQSNFSWVQKINIPQLGPSDVLCDSHTVGDDEGWIVIQQRIDGKENFYRDWNTYRNGFGSFEADFFIGLEKLHKLTKDQKQELYIQMKGFDGSTKYVRYNNFKVGSEREGYKLISLGEYINGDAIDALRWHENQKFTTYDRDNDQRYNDNCADIHRGGWWYNSCTASNLNGQYSENPTKWSKVYWANYVALKEVKMLIRHISKDVRLAQPSEDSENK